MDDSHFLGISEAARQVGVAENTLRTYEKRGVIAPLRDSAGRRLFRQDDIERAREYRNRSAKPDHICE